MLVRSKKRNPNYYLELHLIFTISLLPFFCGLVGAIAITRVEKGNHTWCGDSNSTHASALHYGLALGSYKFFFGHVFVFHKLRIHLYFYLFIVKYLKYPTTKQLDDKSQNR
jgi:hypothetical protein